MQTASPEREARPAKFTYYFGQTAVPSALAERADPDRPLHGFGAQFACGLAKRWEVRRARFDRLRHLARWPARNKLGEARRPSSGAPADPAARSRRFHDVFAFRPLTSAKRAPISIGIPGCSGPRRKIDGARAGERPFWAMPLVACPECGTPVSDIATACPQCGRQTMRPGARPRRRNPRSTVALLSAALGVTAGLWLRATAIERSLREETETVRARADADRQDTNTLISTMLPVQTTTRSGDPVIACDSVDSCVRVRGKWLEATATCWQGDSPPSGATKCSEAARGFVAANAAYMVAWGKDVEALLKQSQ